MIGEPLGKHPPVASRIITIVLTCLETYANLVPKGRQITKLMKIKGMDGRTSTVSVTASTSGRLLGALNVNRSLIQRPFHFKYFKLVPGFKYQIVGVQSRMVQL